MPWDAKLEMNEELKNEKLAKLFECSRTGKIRRSAAHNCLIVVWNSMESSADRWTGDVLSFTGAQEADDHAMNNALNRALRDSRKDGVPVYLFGALTADSYIYYGIVELAGEPHQEARSDSNGETRTVWVFPLKYAGAEPKKSEDKPYEDELNHIFSSDNSQAAEKKRGLAPDEKLRRRIKRQFAKKKYLGDIQISDEEYALLLDYMRGRFKAMAARCSFKTPDEAFCVGMVQIGIRCYEDGVYWPKFQQEMRVSTNGGIQSELSDMFEETLRRNGHEMLDNQRFVNQLLLQGFVTDRYAGRLFDYLYDYYQRELFCCLGNLKGRLKALLRAMARNDRGQVKIVTQTADAIAYNPGSAQTRVQGLLRRIDKAYWDEELPGRERSNRLTRAFLDWLDERGRAVMNNDRAGSGARSRGDKRFSSPTIRYSPKDGTFALALPPQIVNDEDANNLRWEIDIGACSDYQTCNPLEVYTGWRVDGMKKELSDSALLFEKMEFRLMSGERRVRRFAIAAAPIRFFDEDGVWVRDNKLSAGRAISFSRPDFTPESSARTYIADMRLGEAPFIYAEYSFEKDDIVYFPDGEPLCVGGTLREGLLKRGAVAGARVPLENGTADVYRASPLMYMQIRQEQLNGTKLTVNGRAYRLSEDAPGLRTFNPMDRSGEIGCLIELSEYGCRASGAYAVDVDVPADRTDRSCRFQLIAGLSYAFEDAPYVYKDAGTISVPARCGLTETQDTEKPEAVDGWTYFSFKLLPGRRWIGLDAQGVRVEFKVPMFEYCFEDGAWRTSELGDVWKKDFKQLIWIRCDGGEPVVSMMDENDELHEAFISYDKEKDAFKCDMNAFKSYLTRERPSYTIYMTLPGAAEKIPFQNVYTHAVVLKAPAALKVDARSGCVRALFDIIGRDAIYADLYRGDELICEKAPLVNNELVLNGDFENGMYRVELFEEEDDDGFGADYLPIGKSYDVELINPGDLRGKSVEIVDVCSREDQPVRLRMKRTCRIYNLRRMGAGYAGDMVIRSQNSNEIRERCEGYLELSDPENLQSAYVGFVEEGEPLPFLYDNERSFIVRYEDRLIPSYKRYRRYSRTLYDGDYSFSIHFIAPTAEELREIAQMDDAAPEEAADSAAGDTANDTPATASSRSEVPEETEERLSDETSLRETELSLRVCHVLEINKGIHTMGELRAYIAARGTQALEKLRGLGEGGFEELNTFIYKHKLNKTEE